MKIDFVSDVSCPWCAIGLASLQTALARIGPGLPVALHFQPFELNPHMAPEGEDAIEHLSRKYGIDAAEIARNQANIRARGASVGFTFEPGARKRVYNTFDAHRLLHWAGTVGEARQLALKQALLEAYFTHGKDPSSHEVRAQAAEAAGLDAAQAREILASGTYADEVREAEAFYQERGIHSVPAVIIDDTHLISGGQPPEVFERALRQLAQQAA
jgi:predicted DsbA family dithiol-disulfide isomerase